ncbi:MAG: ABC transporter permease subunit [Firmicutes bacterium]|nr:ABC transporter permease subunit [Bacillota bacterium]
MNRFILKKNNPALKILSSAAAVAFWIGIWWIAAIVVGRELLVPSPARVAVRLAELSADVSFWQSAFMSLLRILIGFSAGIVFGTAAACISFISRAANSLVSPLMTVIRTTPVASFIILALVWIRAASVPSFIAFLMVTPVVWKNVHSGLMSASPGLREVCECFGVGKFRRAALLYIPAAAPFFASSAITSLGLAWKAGIAAEVLCTPKFSIGKQLYESKLYLETADLFAWTAVVIIFSVILERILTFVLKKIAQKT